MGPHPTAESGNAVKRVCESVERHGVFPARPDEIARGREVAVRLIGPPIATLEALIAVHERTGVGAFVFRDDQNEAQGFMGAILLRPSGLAKIEADIFDALDPDIDDVCLPHEAPAAVYSWGFAADTLRAAGAMVLAKMAMRDDALPHVPFFCRAATPAGAKVALGKMGYAPFPSSNTGILIKRPQARSTERAA